MERERRGRRRVEAAQLRVRRPPAHRRVVGELVEAYHASLAILLSPQPVSLTSFASFFTCTWVYFSAAAIAEMQLGVSSAFPIFGFWLTIVHTAFLSLFVFGLYEAGHVVEAPLEAVMRLINAEDMGTALALDLAALVDEQGAPLLM